MATTTIVMVAVIAGPQTGQKFEVRVTPSPDMSEEDVRGYIATICEEASAARRSVRAVAPSGTPLVIGAEFLRNNTLAFH